MASDNSRELIGLFTEDCQYVQLQHHKVYQHLLRKWLGKELLITVKPLVYKRSLAQNRYYWVIVEHIRQWLYETQGEKFTKDEVHIWIRKSLMDEQPKITEVAGEQVITMTGKQASKMSVQEFAEMVDTIIAKMAEKGCVIPEPTKKGHNFSHELLIDD